VASVISGPIPSPSISVAGILLILLSPVSIIVAKSSGLIFYTSLSSNRGILDITV